MSKKPAAKQVSIAAFFSPQAAKSAAPASPVRPKTKEVVAVDESPMEIDAAAFKTPPPAKAAASVGANGKRKRGGDAKPRAKKQILTAAAEDEGGEEGDEDAGESVVDLTASSAEKSAKKRGRTLAAKKEKAPAKRKAPAAKKAKPNAKAKAAAAVAAAPVRYGVSPHERTGDDDDDVSDDDDEEMEEKPQRVEAEQAADTLEAEEEADKQEEKATDKEKEEEEEDAIEFEPIATPEPAKPRKAPASAKAKKPTKAQAAAASVVSLISPATSPQKTAPPVAEPADPVVRARIASYQQKIDELTRLCDRLSHSRDADDAVLQEIYGLGLDVELDAAEATDDERDAWRQLGDSTASELPATLKRFVARATQSRSDSLTQLVARIGQLLGSQSNATSTLALEMEIKMLAQRTSYGARQAKANLYEDTTPEALWCWEVNNVDLYFEDDAQKTIKRLRKQRKRTGAQLKSLSRVVQLLHHTPTIDEAKVSQEEVKIGKFVSQVESELQKARDREKKENDKVRKEQEKAQALEEKKRVEHEKLLAKEEEKKKKELEAEAEKLLAEKRKKSLVSYFRSIDTIPEPGATTGATSGSIAGGVAGVGATAVLAVPVGAGGRLTLIGAAGVEQRVKMARMDREVSFFFQEATEVEDVTPTSPSRTGKALFQRRRGIVSARVGHWGFRQYRDKKLGIMKMLQFHENHRPAYNGTFSKRSSTFRRGRRPFAQYAKFDYSVDSEEEWEEEEPGESLSGADSDMDGEDDDDQLDYGDDWLAYEDEVEYVDGEEHDDEDVVMDDDADGDDESANSQAAAASRKRRRKRVAAENKKQKLTKLAPEIRGPFVCCETSGCDHLASFAGEMLEATPEFVSPLMKRAEAREEAAAAAAVAAAAQLAAQQQQTQAADAAATTTSTTTTPVVKKKAKTPKKAAVMEAPVTATTTTATPTTHKPPVKRKISPQLVTASSNGSSDVPAKPKVAKKAVDALASQQAAAAPKVSPVKSGITGWLKTPATSSSSSGTTPSKTPTASTSSTATTAEAAETTSETVAPVKAPVEI